MMEFQTTISGLERQNYNPMNPVSSKAPHPCPSLVKLELTSAIQPIPGSATESKQHDIGRKRTLSGSTPVSKSKKITCDNIQVNCSQDATRDGSSSKQPDQDEPEVDIIGVRLSFDEQMALQRKNVELQKQLDKTNELLKLKSEEYELEEAERKSSNSFFQTKIALLKDECLKHTARNESQKKQLIEVENGMKIADIKNRDLSQRFDKVQEELLKEQRANKIHEDVVKTLKKEKEGLERERLDQNKKLEEFTSKVEDLTSKIRKQDFIELNKGDCGKTNETKARKTTGKEAESALEQLGCEVEICLKKGIDDRKRNEQQLELINSKNKVTFEKLEIEVRTLAKELQKETLERLFPQNRHDTA